MKAKVEKILPFPQPPTIRVTLEMTREEATALHTAISRLSEHDAPGSYDLYLALGVAVDL